MSFWSGEAVIPDLLMFEFCLRSVVLEEWITIQSIMETVFFETEQQIMLEYLIGSLWGLNWKNVLLCARDTVKDYRQSAKYTSL